MGTHHVRTLNSYPAKRRNFSHGLGLVDFSSILLNSHLFEFVIGAMVSRKSVNLVASFSTHDCSWISDIRDIDHIVDNQTRDSTRTAFVKIVKSPVSLTFVLLVNHVQEHLFSLSKSVSQSIFWIWGKCIISDNKLMQIVSQKISTHISPVTIIHCEERAFRPWGEMRFVRRTSHVQNDGDSILVVVPNDALVGVGSVSSHNSISFKRAFWGFKVRQLQLLRVRHVRPKKVNSLSFWVSCWLSFDLSQLRLHILFLRILFLGCQRKGELFDDSFIRLANSIKIHLYIIVKMLKLTMQLVPIKFRRTLSSFDLFISFWARRSLCFFARSWVNRLPSVAGVDLHSWWRRVKLLLF